MYGDDLDLCIRFALHGHRIVYDGRVSITHIKGVSVGREHASMSRAIFDANLAVYLKHFNPKGSRMVEWKYRAAFGLWKRIALLRAWLTGRKKVQPA
jgi:GT2 family glycosyltransferase